MEFQKQGIEQNTRFVMKMSLYVDYWEDILLHLTKPLLAQRSILLKGFQPSKNWKLKYARAKLPSTTLIVDLEDPVIRPYYGPKNLKLAPAYISFRDINNRDFVLMRFMILSLSLFSWEQHIVMLSRIIKMNSSKW